MEILKELGMIIMSVLGALGGWEFVKYLLHRKENARKVEAEADKSEFSVLKETNIFLQEQLKAKEERFADQTKVLRETNQQLLDAEKKIGQLLAERALKLCERKGCGTREPFSGY